MSDDQPCRCGRTRVKVIERLNETRTWMGKDSDRLIFRRFEDLSVRNLLRLQHELTDLEQEINAVCGTCTDQDVEKYDALMARANLLLSSYQKAFCAYQSMKKNPHTPDFMLKGLRDANTQAANNFRDEHVGRTEFADLSSIRMTEKGVIHRYLNTIGWLTRSLGRMQNPGQDSSIHVYSDNLFWYIDQLVLNCCVIALISIPIVVLMYVPGPVGKLFAVLGFVVLAAPLTSVIAENYSTKNNMPLMLAYVAILVAFLGQTSLSSPST